jgi:hypothetical protein
MFSDKHALWMLLLPLLFWQFRGLINLGGVFGCVISEGPWLFVGLPNVVKVWQAFLIVFYITLNPICGGRRVCDEITRQGRILMQRQYTSILVDSEALEVKLFFSQGLFHCFPFFILDCNFNMRHLCCSASVCNLCRQDGTAQLSIFSSILR